MAARQLRWLLLGELVWYAVLGGWLLARAGWTPLQVAAFGLAWALGMRLFFVLMTFGLMLRDSSAVPENLRIGPIRALRMVFEEYAALCLLFSVIQPFESFWLGPDRLNKPRGERLPVLLVHGYQCNRGFWIWLRPRLEAAGWTTATHNMEPPRADIDSYADGIERRIDQVLAATGAQQVNLVGHSMGGLVLRAYLRRHGRKKVARIVTLGSPHQGTRLAPLGLGRNARQMHIDSSWLAALARPGAVPLPSDSVSIFSFHDNYVFPQRACSTLEGATNVVIGGISHLGMAFSPVVAGKLLEALGDDVIAEPAWPNGARQ